MGRACVDITVGVHHRPNEKADEQEFNRRPSSSSVIRVDPITGHARTSCGSHIDGTDERGARRPTMASATLGHTHIITSQTTSWHAGIHDFQ